MRKVGLGWVCDGDCTVAARGRATRVARRKSSEAPREIRFLVKERDGNRCRFCGGISSLAVHHISYRSEGIDHREQNLVTLCQLHHMEVHSDKARWKPVLVALMKNKVFLTVPEMEAYMKEHPE